MALAPDAWAAALRERGVDPDTTPNPLAFTEPMREAARAVTTNTDSLQALEALQQSLFGAGSSVPFLYVADETSTAELAFERRRGNCVAITSLFIAMARSIGIPVEPALVSRRGGEEKEGDLVIVRNHVVAVFRDGGQSTVFDFYVSRSGPAAGIQPIDDLWATALYLNNDGARALRNGDAPAAARAFEGALRLAPSYGPVYGNLGVARRRMGDRLGALDAHLLSLQLSSRSDLVRGNLFTLFEEISGSGLPVGAGDGWRTTAYGRRMAEAEREFFDGAAGRAVRLYRQAGREAPERPEPLVWIARCELYRRKTADARRALRSALALSGNHAEARRLLDGLERIVP